MQLVGRGKAMEMMMTGNMISANEALFLGLVNHVVPAEDLLPQTVTIFKNNYGQGPLAIAKVVELINVASYNAASGLAEK